MPSDLPASLSESVLTFDDEFSSFSGSLNGQSGWMTQYPYWGSEHSFWGEEEYYSDPAIGVNPFNLSNGVLTISATSATGANANPLNLPFNSGVITTYKSFSQLYGYFEVRAQLPSGQGLWPAFWMLPTDLHSTELDIFEVLGNRADILYATTHSATPSGLSQAVAVADTSTGFHTYGVDWEPSTITFYMDGQAIAHAATPSDMNSSMFMLLNLAVGGPQSWPGAPNNTTPFPASMQIDYVRAYSTASTVGMTEPTPQTIPAVILPAVQAVAHSGTSWIVVSALHYGNQDGGSLVPGIGIALLNDADQVIATGVTGSDSKYVFWNLAAGTYRVQYVLPPNLRLRPGGDADLATGLVAPFSVAEGGSANIWDEGVLSQAELVGATQPGAIVSLLDSAGATLSTTLANATGQFAFWTPAGTYMVQVGHDVSVPIALADGQSFRLSGSALSAEAAVSTATLPTELVPPPTTLAIELTPTTTIEVYRLFNSVTGEHLFTTSFNEAIFLRSTQQQWTLESSGIQALDPSDKDNHAISVYRFFNDRTGTHFFTASAAERDAVSSNRRDMVFEGTFFKEFSTPISGTEPVYRFFDNQNGTQLFVQNNAEYATILANRSDLIPEGIAFYAPNMNR